MNQSDVLRLVANRLNEMYQVGMANAGLSEQEIATVNAEVALLQIKDMLGLTNIFEPVQ